MATKQKRRAVAPAHLGTTHPLRPVADQESLRALVDRQHRGQVEDCIQPGQRLITQQPPGRAQRAAGSAVTASCPRTKIDRVPPLPRAHRRRRRAESLNGCPSRSADTKGRCPAVDVTPRVPAEHLCEPTWPSPLSDTSQTTGLRRAGTCAPEHPDSRIGRPGPGLLRAKPALRDERVSATPALHDRLCEPAVFEVGVVERYDLKAPETFQNKHGAAIWVHQFGT